MKRTTLIRILSTALAVLMLACVFAACSNNTDVENPDETTTAAQGENTPDNTNPVETTPSDVDENGYKLDGIPEDLDYAGKKITLLYWSDREHEEFFVTDQTGENVNDALFYRNLAIEERLGIEMDFVGTPGNSDNISNWTKYIQNVLQAGNDEFDVMGSYSLSMAASANKGFCYDLLDDDCQYLDFDMPWWPERLITEATINNKLYFCSGDISANALYMMYVCYVNNDIIKNMSLENVFQLVNDNKWTYTKFMEMCNNVYIDLDADGAKSVGDQFGYMSSGIHVDPWFYGSGALIVDKDAEGNLKPADTFGGEKVIKTIEMLNNLLWNTNDGIYTSKVNHQQEFNNGHLLFTTDRARIAITKLNSEDLNFSVVPFPKYDEAQESFVTVVGNPFTLYALPIDTKVEELPMLSAYLETYASESYRQVTPELYEVTLKTKYVQNEDSAVMYDIIRESITFDLGRIFSNVLIGQSAFRNAISSNLNNWASTVKGYSKTLPKMLNKLIEAYSD